MPRKEQLAIKPGFSYPIEGPASRWTRIQHLVLMGEKPARSDDKWLWRGYRFLRAYQDSKTESERFNLCLDHKDAAKAVGWYMEPGQRRYYVEAMTLCTDLTLERQAEIMLATPRAITLYEKLFFDMREHRRDPDVVLANVMQPALVAKVSNARDPDLALKLAAVFQGFELVRTFYGLFDVPDAVQQRMQASGLGTLFRDFATGSYFRDVNKYDIQGVIDSVMRYLEVEVKRQMAEGSGVGDDEKFSLVAEVMSGVHFYIADPDTPVEGPVEPRLFHRIEGTQPPLPFRQ